MIRLDLFYSPYCACCASLRPRLRCLAAACRPPVEVRELDIVSHVEEAVSAGVISTPALVVGGRVRLAGSASETELTSLLRALSAPTRTRSRPP